MIHCLKNALKYLPSSFGHLFLNPLISFIDDNTIYTLEGAFEATPCDDETWMFYGNQFCFPPSTRNSFWMTGYSELDHGKRSGGDSFSSPSGL